MWNGIWIEAQFANRPARPTVIVLVNGVRENKLRLSLGTVALNRNDDRRADQNAIVLLLRRYEGAFFDAEALAQIRRDDNGSALAYPCRLHSAPLSLPDYTICL